MYLILLYLLQSIKSKCFYIISPLIFIFNILLKVFIDVNFSIEIQRIIFKNVLILKLIGVITTDKYNGFNILFCII